LNLGAPEARRLVRIGTMKFPSLRLLAVLMIGVMAVASGPSAYAKDPKKVLNFMDQDGDGKISANEWRKSANVFDKADRDSDGYLTLKELSKFFKAKAGKGADNAPSQPPASQAAPVPSPAAAGTLNMAGWQGPIIDAHSQVDGKTDLASLIPLLDQAGVARVILSTRFEQPSSDVTELAQRHPERIIPAAKTKSKAFMKGHASFPDVFYRELKLYPYRAAAEVIMWHAAKKGVGAGKAAMEPDDPRVLTMIKIARQQGWPYIAHIEFAAMDWDKSGYMEKFETLLEDNRDIPVGLIHMGQLDLEDVVRLLPRHPNLFFITSHSNPVTTSSSKLPWTRMFMDDDLISEWRDLIINNPTRFVLAFDNVFSFHWEQKFMPQVKLWREVLAKFPGDVAHALAHGNAERLWDMEPLID
jgi:predicted TIM-barrel fold metal-dependent hydrolase